ncbi:MAG TPA: hypothetical protein VJH20_05485 [Candidatus Nanoarchaeia archaeon]|nr:hypothetical protein [Candidatus Nanoarchaeia archaeon]
MSQRKGQELPLNTIVIALIILLVFVILVIVYWDQLSAIFEAIKKLAEGSSGLKDVKID